MFLQRSGTASGSSRMSHIQPFSSTTSHHRSRGAYSSVSSHEAIPLQTSGTRRRHIGGWPQGPRTLHKEGREYAGLIVRDFLTIGATIPFLLLVAYAWSKNGDVINDSQWQKIQTATKVAVTAFPIVFAAVMGQATRTVATWRLQRGIRIGQLEQLLWSSTFFSNLSIQCLLGSFNLLALGLLCIWVLSPLGGQSSLHIIGTAAQMSASSANVSTFNTEMPSLFNSRADILGHIPTLNGIYATSLTAPESVKNSPMDLWGNVKVPAMSRLNSNNPVNESGWRNVNQSEVIPYSSLVGLPVSVYPPTGNTTFNIESSYFDINCDSLTLGAHAIPITRNVNFTSNRDPPHVIKLPNGTFIGSNGTDSCPQRDCQVSLSLAIDHYVQNRAFSESDVFSTVKGNGQASLSSSPTLLFQSRYWKGLGGASTVARCNVTSVYVESVVECRTDPKSVWRRQCSVTAMRDSQLPHPASDITPFLFAGMFLRFSGRLAQAANPGRRGRATLTERYINNTASPLLASDVNNPLFQLPKPVFSQRLTQIINTYYLASILPEAIIGDFPRTISVTNDPFLSNSAQNLNDLTGTISTSHNIYVINPHWMAAFLASSLVMFVAAVVSAFLSHLISIPDVLGYASSLTRDSPYVTLPPGGSTLPGLERSRLLRREIVRLGDVQRDDGIGYLAIADLDRAGRPRKDKLYD